MNFILRKGDRFNSGGVLFTFHLHTEEGWNNSLCFPHTSVFFFFFKTEVTRWRRYSNIPTCSFQWFLLMTFSVSVCVFQHVCGTPGMTLYLSVSLSGGVCPEVRRPRRLLVLINPKSGKGQALALFNNHVQHMLEEADITYTLQVTGENTLWNILRHSFLFLHVVAS